MNIIFGKENADIAREKNTVLEVDTVKVGNSELQCFALLTIEDIPVNELVTLNKQIDLHNFAVDKAKQGDFGRARDAISGLKGKFNKLLDGFYEHTEERMTEAEQNVASKWEWPFESK